MQLFFFRKKKQKALFCFAEGSGNPDLGEADPGGLGACPQRAYLADAALLFPEKEAKSAVLLRRRAVGNPNLGKADPGGLGACPQKAYRSREFKKSVGLVRNKANFVNFRVSMLVVEEYIVTGTFVFDFVACLFLCILAEEAGEGDSVWIVE
jgi:hypothetical protein